ncbi:Ldh family oxidoreductase [Desulfoscipio gibsoniae]|uniref:Malate/lactate dehydrogenase n=1 Tax=Desulfoscipio gibsoniae DSM 7213 TaxID=767817 RepID=R4KGP0_9FIRM|nr:Ldh family oxidoreductase [Desulfoscipio gibsoniae]AGK99684.1 malate/lactate dehydrogenase [Desulfoscipio gibsoniae DSM 7213]
MDATFSAETLQLFCINLLVKSGVPYGDAEVVASVIIDTSLDGIDTHGISRLPVYLTCLQKGRINCKPEITVIKTAPSVAIIDGDNGLGQLVAVRAMEEAMKMARETGAGVVPVRHSNHFGAATYYCKMTAGADMFGMAFTNSPPGIPPWGGKKPYLGTNPISFGFPTGEIPVIVDMSSCNVARGNIILAAREGRAIPKGWAIDDKGKPTTDANKALEGAMLPLGGAKGYALALAVEMLSGIASGSAFGRHVGWIYNDSMEPADVGHFFIAINIANLMPVPEYIDRVELMKSEIRSVPLAENFDRIFLPGERKQIKATQRAKEGIPIKSGVLKELNKIAILLGAETL